MPLNLLDTHTLIWFIDGNKELSPTARVAIEANNADNYVSIASLWEIAIKISLGKPELKTPFNQISRQITANGFDILPVTFEETLLVASLPFHHKDPFDRMIIAQAITNKLTVTSKDELFAQYSVQVVW